jgi:microcystin degradation protein MlrC
MARIAIGGWQHETNTFATARADYASFESADEWPGMHTGQEMIAAVRDVHLPIAGAIAVLEERQQEILPVLWCSATPCSFVTEDAFETISGRMLALLDQALPVDAVYLDLHGAMVCEHLQDGEGEFLARIRNLVGSQVPVYVSLDLHANVTQLMVDSATVLDIYRTYPHIDMGETGHRVTTLLCDQLQNPAPLFKSFRQIEFLIPLNSGCTLIEPCKTIYNRLPELINEQVPSLSFACGFHLSDIYDVGPAVVGYGVTEQEADGAVELLAGVIHARQKDFHEKIWPVEHGIIEAEEAFKAHGATVVIADTQDNPGGGGSGDTTGVLQAMIERSLDNAVVGVINDAEVATMAHEVGIGGEFFADLGGKTPLPGQESFRCKVEVQNISDGRFTATGPMYKGAHMELGPCALLRISGISVVVCSKAVQTADQEVFRHIGIEPGAMDYIALKSSVHFRNDFTDLASRIIIVSAPGEVFADPATLHYKNIRPGIEITRMT